MHPAFQYDMAKAQQQDQLRSAARRHLAAQAQAARRARGDAAPTPPPRRVLRLVSRLLTAKTAT